MLAGSDTTEMCIVTDNRLGFVRIDRLLLIASMHGQAGALPRVRVIGCGARAHGVRARGGLRYPTEIDIFTVWRSH